MSIGRGGKEWESLVGHGCRQAPAYTYNCNDGTPESDFRTVYRGLAFLIEAKKTEENRFPASLVKPHQRASLETNWAKGGGISVIIIKQIRDGNERSWWVTWPDFLTVLACTASRSWVEDVWLMEKRRIYTKVELPDVEPRRKFKSLALVDGERSERLVPLGEVRRRHGARKGERIWVPHVEVILETEFQKYKEALEC